MAAPCGESHATVGVGARLQQLRRGAAGRGGDAADDARLVQREH